MTQDLVVGVLLVGFVGLIWAMAVTVLWGDQRNHAASPPEVEPNRDEVNKSSHTRRTLAA
jgi:hypothetical protein